MYSSRFSLDRMTGSSLLILAAESGNSSISNSTASGNSSQTQSLPAPSDEPPSGIHFEPASNENVTFRSSSSSTSSASSIRMGMRASSALVGLWSFVMVLRWSL